MTGVDSVARDLFRKFQKSSVKCCVEELENWIVFALRVSQLHFLTELCHGSRGRSGVGDRS